MSRVSTKPTGGKTITIEAKRWFQRTYGNTYHSCRVFHGGELVGAKSFCHGYGDHYLNTAAQILCDAGLLMPMESDHSAGKEDALRQDMREHRNRYVVCVADVAREKDL